MCCCRGVSSGALAWSRSLLAIGQRCSGKSSGDCLHHSPCGEADGRQGAGPCTTRIQAGVGHSVSLPAAAGFVNSSALSQARRAFASEAAKHSNRPIETITPLSQALHLRINHDYEDRETAKVADAVMSGKYAGKVVLICWHHGEIPHLAKAFGVEDAPEDMGRHGVRQDLEDPVG